MNEPQVTMMVAFLAPSPARGDGELSLDLSRLYGSFNGIGTRGTPFVLLFALNGPITRVIASWPENGRRQDHQDQDEDYAEEEDYDPMRIRTGGAVNHAPPSAQEWVYPRFDPFVVRRRSGSSWPGGVSPRFLKHVKTEIDLRPGGRPVRADIERDCPLSPRSGLGTGRGRGRLGTPGAHDRGP